MGLSNYSELKQSVINWSKRSDLDLLIDDFIDLTETKMLSNEVENLVLRTQGTRSQATLPISTRFLELPPGFLSMRKMRLIDNQISIPLSFMTPSEMHVTEFDSVPTQFTVTSQIEFNAPAVQEYTVEMQHIAEFVPLTSTNTNNIVLVDNPDVYLYGCLWAANRYAQDLEEEGRYLVMFQDAIKGANRKTKEGKYGPRPRIIPRGTKP